MVLDITDTHLQEKKKLDPTSYHKQKLMVHPISQQRNSTTRILWGHLGAQLVKRLTLDLGSGHDLTVCEIEPLVWFCTDSVEPACDSLSPCLPLPCLHPPALARSCSQNK